MQNCCFAIVPDDIGRPTALFDDLEEAIAWALKKYGGNKFVIRHAQHIDGTKDRRRAAA
jgi:hypothetical protein